MPGVANSNIYGGAEREMQVIIDPHALASCALTILDVRKALISTNVNISGGDMDEGKNRFTVRTLGQFKSVEEIESLPITKRDDISVYIRDVAEVKAWLIKNYKHLSGRKMRHPIAVNAQREVGANVLLVMAGLKEACRELNDNLLRDRGLTVRTGL